MLVIMTNIAPRPPACPASRPTLSLRAANQRREAAALTNQRRKAAGGGSLTTGSQTGSGSVSVQWAVGEWWQCDGLTVLVMSSFSSSFSTQALMVGVESVTSTRRLITYLQDRTEAKPAERPVYHPYSLGTEQSHFWQCSAQRSCLDSPSYSYSPASSSLIKTSPSLPPCQPYKTPFTSSLSSGLTTLGDYSGGGLYQSQYQHNLAFTDQASLSAANALLTNNVSDFQDSSAVIKTENDNCNNLDEEEDNTEEEEKSDKEDCKGDSNKPPFSYVAMIGESSGRNWTVIANSEDLNNSRRLSWHFKSLLIPSNVEIIQVTHITLQPWL